jgi:hypothetical protein
VEVLCRSPAFGQDRLEDGTADPGVATQLTEARARLAELTPPVS